MRTRTQSLTAPNADRRYSSIRISTYATPTTKIFPAPQRMDCYCYNFVPTFPSILYQVASFIFSMDNYVDLGYLPPVESFDGSMAMDGDEYVRCSRCGFGGCDVRVSSCGCTLHAVRRICTKPNCRKLGTRSSHVCVLPEHADRHDRMDISKHDVMLSRLIKCQLPKPSNLVDEIAASPPLRPLLACCNVPVYITYHTSLSHARAMILFLLPPKFDSVVLF